MLKFFQKFIFKKFVLIVGDNGVRLTLFEKGLPIETIEVGGVHDDNIGDVASLLRKYAKVPVYIFSDVSEQSFKHITIPSTNPIVIKKLLTRRIERDFKKGDLHSYYPFKDKDDTDKNSSHYIIVNVARIPPLSEWLEYLKNVPNTIDAVYVSPIELHNLPHDLETHLKKKGKAVPASRWKMLVIQSKIGGFRIIVTKDDQVIFSRMLNFEEELDAEYVETLKNQIIGTVEYLRRVGFKDKHGITLFLLFYDSLHEVFDTGNIKGYTAIKVHQEDVASVVYGNNLPASRIHSIEQDICGYFVKKGEFVSFYTKNLEAVSILNNINVGLTLTSMFSVFFVILYILINTQSINSIKQSAEKYEFRKEKLSLKLETIRQEKFGFDIDEDKVIDVSKLHEKLIDQQIDPLEVIIKLSIIKPDNIKIKNYSWRHVEGKAIAFEVDATFVSKNLSYEELFTKYDGFIRELKTEFNKYDIEHSELPDTISFDLNLEDIPIDFQIKGPHR